MTSAWRAHVSGGRIAWECARRAREQGGSNVPIKARTRGGRARVGMAWCGLVGEWPTRCLLWARTRAHDVRVTHVCARRGCTLDTGVRARMAWACASRGRAHVFSCACFFVRTVFRRAQRCGNHSAASAASAATSAQVAPQQRCTPPPRRHGRLRGQHVESGPGWR